MALSILRPGLFTTVQDLGRWGLQSRGVPVSGALDWYSHRLANTLLGNDAAMATLEVTLMGPEIRFDADATFAVAGAEFRLTLDGAAVDMDRPTEAKAGSVLKFGERLRGARAYVAIAGGIDVQETLGSRSTHVLTGIGGLDGRALRAGDAVRTAVPGNVQRREARIPSHHTPFPGRFDRNLRVMPADDRLFAHLTSQPFQVSPRSDRMGYRLEGAAMTDAPTGELISTAVPTGAIQVPPTGQPILLMNDHATTGGYAIAGTVITADLPIAAQLAPGDDVSFVACSMDIAVAALREREAMLGAA